MYDVDSLVFVLNSLFYLYQYLKYLKLQVSTTNEPKWTRQEGTITTVSKIGYGCTETDSIDIFCKWKKKTIKKIRKQSLEIFRQRNCHFSVLRIKVIVVLIRFENICVFNYTIYSKSTRWKWCHINFIRQMHGCLHTAASIICTIVYSDQEHTNVICIWFFPFVKIMNEVGFQTWYITMLHLTGNTNSFYYILTSNSKKKKRAQNTYFEI